MKLSLLFFIFSVPCFAQEYFPKSNLSADQRSQWFKAGWYSSQLKALQEPPLYSEKIDAKAECYRFTWLRTFHRPVAFRVDVQPDGTGQFIIKVADGAGGYKPGKLVRNEKKTLDEHMVEMIRAHFMAEKFFEIPSYEEGRLGVDGSEWILEATKNGKYHVVSRWSPDTGPVHRIGMQLIEIAIGGDFMPIY